MSWRAEDFETAAALGSLLARDYSRPMFELLVTYRDLAASEAASRLNLHIRTVQDYLDALTDLGIATKTEVREGKRPYYRYSLAEQKLTVALDLGRLTARSDIGDGLARRIRERAGSGADFVPARGANRISSVSYWERVANAAGGAEKAAGGNGSGRGARGRRQRRRRRARSCTICHSPGPTRRPWPRSCDRPAWIRLRRRRSRMWLGCWWRRGWWRAARVLNLV